MDARTALDAWIDKDRTPHENQRGREGRLLQGTSPRRYRDDVLAWLAFMDKVGLDALRATPSHVKTWLDSEGGAVRARARRVSALSAYYAYCAQLGHAADNPAIAQLRGRPQDEPGLPQLTPGQMHLLRWGADQITGDMAARDRLFMYLMLAGLRSRQITELQLGNLHFEQQRLTCDLWQKGGGTRRYAVSDEVRQAVRTYLPERTWRPPASHEETGPLLVTYRGNPLDPNTTPRTILHATIRHALACPDPEAPELTGRITPDIVAHSPSPFDPLEKA
ncbi:site-specific integrase [Streptomyces sp. NBC_01242]|uniref:tyrosine-type recombinase/integrase n=1 Tax=Streptomyces sp. NBC_01242 TaxID=2903795 RepID=UPI00224EFE27|nr:tyrosine-type recombinase/integrase [Streptomyces sp. NBC_01242]MCX4799663.1 site-specific integrase [Streptomyces sp. NBC_01242]